MGRTVRKAPAEKAVQDAHTSVSGTSLVLYIVCGGAVEGHNRCGLHSAWVRSVRQHKSTIRGMLGLAAACSRRWMTIGPRKPVSALQQLAEVVEKESKQFVARGSGPGGQSINKTMNAVTMIHEPTGLIVRCQDTRSIQQNKNLALKRLTAKVLMSAISRGALSLSLSLLP